MAWEAIDYALDAVSQTSDIEVQKEADSASRSPQVREKLSRVNRRQSVDGLDLHNHSPVDQEIKLVSAFQFDVAILEGQCLLPFDSQSAILELMREARLIR